MDRCGIKPRPHLSLKVGPSKLQTDCAEQTLDVTRPEYRLKSRLLSILLAKNVTSDALVQLTPQRPMKEARDQQNEQTRIRLGT